ncbi:MAG: amylo-alpha-1,6-glucosidase [Candidatus Promineifilaceae bacterium]
MKFPELPLLPVTIDFGRQVVNDGAAAEKCEWLITNGIGGYASGTITGSLGRCYHGLLVAALQPPLGRTLLVSKLDETVRLGEQRFRLYSNRWSPEQVEPQGYFHLDRFHREGTTPVWTYSLADGLLEKRIWMQPGANTTYIRYDYVRGTRPLTMHLKAIVNYRDHHGRTREEDWEMDIRPVPDGLCCQVQGEENTPFYLLCRGAAATPRQVWYKDYYLPTENYRGLPDREDHLYAGLFQASLHPGQGLTMVVTTDAAANRDGHTAYQERHTYEATLLAPLPAPSLPLANLHLAADQFIVRRATRDDAEGRTVIAGYHWFSDWGRDTMIALPGLTLATGRPDVARSILRTFARFVAQGMIPNRFPDVGEIPEYNTVDATLWYVEALRAYHAATGDDDLLRELFPIVQDIITWHQKGTRYQIHQDMTDGLLYAGTPGVQLTWMDAKVDDWVVTPRIGKPVEINALWYNALRVMAAFATHLYQPADLYTQMADQVQASFARFWYDEGCYCYDVVEGAHGDDASLRPNQLLAVSLPHSPLSPGKQKQVVAACGRELLTPHGLRSLAPGHPDYQGTYGGDRYQRDGAYHQGTVWGWLIGPFVSAHYRVYGDAPLARSFLEPLLRHLNAHGVGSISEIFDGDPPFTPRGCIAQAWSVAEVLRCWTQLTGI